MLPFSGHQLHFLCIFHRKLLFEKLLLQPFFNSAQAARSKLFFLIEVHALKLLTAALLGVV